MCAIADHFRRPSVTSGLTGVRLMVPSIRGSIRKSVQHCQECDCEQEIDYRLPSKERPYLSVPRTGFYTLGIICLLENELVKTNAFPSIIVGLAAPFPWGEGRVAKQKASTVVVDLYLDQFKPVCVSYCPHLQPEGASAGMTRRDSRAALL